MTQIQVLFKDKIPIGLGYGNAGIPNGKISKKSEQELIDLLSPILEEGETWRDKYRYLSLDGDGKVYLDMDRYEEEQE